MSGVTSSTKMNRSSGASSSEVRVARSAREATLKRRGDGDDDCLNDDELEYDNFDDEADDNCLNDDELEDDNFDDDADDSLEDDSFDDACDAAGRDADAIHLISVTLTPCISWCGVIDSVRRRRMKRPTLAISAARLRDEPKSATGSRRRSTAATNRHTSAGAVSVAAETDAFFADLVWRARANDDVAEADVIPSIKASS
jgi:hypothetical protein